MKPSHLPRSGRELAFLAVSAFLDGGSFVADTLSEWQGSLEFIESRFAQEVAYGSVRRLLTLEFFAREATERKKLKLKKSEKALLFTALYQLVFMDRVPAYAAVDESVKIASQYFSRPVVKFLNALLRRLTTFRPPLPHDDSPEALSIRYSYPKELISCLLHDYSLELTKRLLELGNETPQVMARGRPHFPKNPLPSGLEPLADQPFVAVIRDTSLISSLAEEGRFYIQNVTPAYLINELAKKLSSPPSHILDMCASPGGKVLAVHDLFPDAILFANDISPSKVARLTQNLRKYGIQANVSCSPGEKLSLDERFDLIIIDAPCSNSGTLNKRAEARWRFSLENLGSLQELQLALLQQGKSLLKPAGRIAYMTCSILKAENEDLVLKACQKLGLKPSDPPIVQLPNDRGWDGGFAQLLEI